MHHRLITYILFVSVFFFAHCQFGRRWPCILFFQSPSYLSQSPPKSSSFVRHNCPVLFLLLIMFFDIPPAVATIFANLLMSFQPPPRYPFYYLIVIPYFCPQPIFFLCSSSTCQITTLKPLSLVIFNILFMFYYIRVCILIKSATAFFVVEHIFHWLLFDAFNFFYFYIYVFCSFFTSASDHDSIYIYIIYKHLFNSPILHFSSTIVQRSFINTYFTPHTLIQNTILIIVSPAVWHGALSCGYHMPFKHFHPLHAKCNGISRDCLGMLTRPSSTIFAPKVQ